MRFPLRRQPWSRLAGAMAAAALLVVSGWSWYRLSIDDHNTRMAATSPAPLAEEGSMDSYLRQHALGLMDSTFLGSTEGVELASFEVLGPSGR